MKRRIAAFFSFPKPMLSLSVILGSVAISYYAYQEFDFTPSIPIIVPGLFADIILSGNIHAGFGEPLSYVVGISVATLVWFFLASALWSAHKAIQNGRET